MVPRSLASVHGYILFSQSQQFSGPPTQSRMLRLGPKFMHHLPLIMHANFYINQSLYLSEEFPHEKCPRVSLELTMQHFFFLNGLVLLGFFFFFFVQKKVQYDIILGGRWQLSLRDDKIARNTPPAVLHCFNIVLFNKKMTPSAWMTTPKWTINIPYIRKSWKLKYTA